MLRHVRRGAAVLAAEGKALDQSQRHEQDRREPADGLELGQEADQEGGPAHEQDGHEEGVLAADEVADPPEDQGAEGAHQEAGGIRGERRKQCGRRVPRREEQRREERRERGVQVEVVPFEHGAQRGSEDDLLLFLVVDAVDGRRCHESSSRSHMGNYAFPGRCGASFLRRLSRGRADASRRRHAPQLGKTLTGRDNRLDELGDRTDRELLHDAGAVGLDRLDRDLASPRR